MPYSEIRKGFEQVQPVASFVGNSSTAPKSTIQLNKDWFTSEYILHMVITQSASGTANTAFDPGQVIDSITFNCAGNKYGGNGNRIVLAGRDLYNIMRFTEEQTPAPITTFTTSLSSAEYSIDIHMALDGAYNDYATGIHSGDFSALTMTINWSTTSPFSGGTNVGNINIAADISAMTMPAIPVGPNTNSTELGSIQQVYQSQPVSPAGAGNAPDLLLQTGNLTRFVMVRSVNTAGALSDSIVDTIKMNFGGLNYQTSFKQLKNENQNDRGFADTGTAIMDFGDDPLGWLDLRALNQAPVKVSALAAGTVTFTQVMAQAL